jgi:hypothetical protein
VIKFVSDLQQVWFSPAPPVKTTNKTDHHDITEILVKVALNTMNHQSNSYHKVLQKLAYHKVPKINSYQKVSKYFIFVLTLVVLKKLNL